MALLGNQVADIPAASHQPDPIALKSLENILELTSMMSYN
jgi:hypothetical protein